MLDVVPPMVMPLGNKGETYSPSGRNAFGAADEVRRHSPRNENPAALGSVSCIL